MTTLSRGWLHLASGASVGRTLGFFSNLLLSRFLGPTDLGLFNLITTTVQTSDTLARCGGDYALNYELGGEPESVKTERGAELVQALVQLCSISTLLICIGLVIWVWCGHGLFPSSATTTHRYLLTALLVLMIMFEGSSASAWEILLVSRRTAQLSLKQGLFFPLRLISAAIGGLLGGVLGAMACWSLVAFLQYIWLKTILRDLWRPLNFWPLLGPSLFLLLKRGLPFYGVNLLSSMIFYPLLLIVASASGLSEVGYLRAGQILQQFFALVPATLVPVLFLKLRTESSFAAQISMIERPFRIIWFLLLELLLFYCTIDHTLIVWLFGTSFVSALLPTRLLLLTALFECLAQLVVQPLLAAGKTGKYGLWQNGAAVIVALLGWVWIPVSGLAAYLVVRFLYVIIPLIGFGVPLVHMLHDPLKLLPLTLVSIGLLASFLGQSIFDVSLALQPSFFLSVSIILLFLQRNELSYIRNILKSES